MTDITRSPLCWPSWFPRTSRFKRTHGKFGKRASGRSWGRKSLTLAQARSRVLQQLGMFTRVGDCHRVDPDNIIISSDLALRNDDLPRSGQRRPDDPGVAVYFELDGKQRCMPCDAYLRIEDNMAAIAATIEALRTLERHGSQMFEAAFTGFDALPSPDHLVGRSWRDVLDYYGDSADEAKRAYMAARKRCHPDHGGTTDAFHEVETAWATGSRELKGDI
jgi:hypothetical protein